MAAKLSGKPSATIHNLKPGKAKGAGGARGGSKTGAAKLKPSATDKLAVRTPVHDHNKSPTEAQMREHRMERLAALTNQHRAIDNRMEIKKAELDEIRGERSLVRTAIHNLDYPLDEFDRSYKDLRLKTPAIDLEKREGRREEIRETHGMPTLRQIQLNLERPLPEDARVKLHWRAVGYQNGVLGEPCRPQDWGVPPEAMQEAQAGWGDGQAVIAKGLTRLKEDEPVRDAAPLVTAHPDGRPDWSTWSTNHEKWTAEQKLTFLDWYETVDPEITPEMDHHGAVLRFAYLEALAETDEDEPFEATPEEIAGQADRKVVKERRGEGEWVD